MIPHPRDHAPNEDPRPLTSEQWADERAAAYRSARSLGVVGAILVGVLSAVLVVSVVVGLASSMPRSVLIERGPTVLGVALAALALAGLAVAARRRGRR
ncbi:hypothetical protein [Cellulomonas oligotrophica]|uniref:Uncharacterized protein n=1 Tax=Cellulomonas oligotrophica TaxID=931536 RepID=A0A7Y9K0Z4_9CELL|nr:hypothetical protein [Cellulomonas oligotrophica]NYD87800.1 hypothetical protein [Cellulomonas oligotrophica]GIG32995.1 hypothetical protein Col01nite_21540 [Cellulomonas oligotrophica]